MRLIDENVLLEEIEKLPFINEKYDHEHANKSFINGIETFHVMVLNVLKRQPIIRPESLRVHGMWYDKPPIIWHGTSNIPVVQCSECGITFCDIINNHHYMYRYCPYCGAVMDAEVETNETD